MIAPTPAHRRSASRPPVRDWCARLRLRRAREQERGVLAYVRRTVGDDVDALIARPGLCRWLCDAAHETLVAGVELDLAREAEVRA